MGRAATGVLASYPAASTGGSGTSRNFSRLGGAGLPPSSDSLFHRSVSGSLELKRTHAYCLNEAMIVCLCVRGGGRSEESEGDRVLNCVLRCDKAI